MCKLNHRLCWVKPGVHLELTWMNGHDCSVFGRRVYIGFQLPRWVQVRFYKSKPLVSQRVIPRFKPLFWFPKLKVISFFCKCSKKLLFPSETETWTLQQNKREDQNNLRARVSAVVCLFLEISMTTLIKYAIRPQDSRGGSVLNKRSSASAAQAR